MTRRLTPSELEIAAEILRSGGLVAFPTETVYGLGANALDGSAVASIFAAKQRPSFNPLIVHVPDIQSAEKIAVFDEEARHLAKVFWPGPMSLVLPLRSDAGISDLVSSGLNTIAIRVPAHPLATRLLLLAGCPVAAPSANPSGQISPTIADHVLAGLAGKIDAVVDGGACEVGVESTIIGTSPTILLRAGGVALEDIETHLDRTIPVRKESGTLNAPGQMASHYAPDATLKMNAAPDQEAIYIGFGAMDCDLNLSPAGNLKEAAANLFASLRDADALANGRVIAVAPLPNEGLGLAINDRLKRAAAPRD